MNNRYNLIDEKWVPVTPQGFVSLSELFSPDQYVKSFSGTTVEKIALLKFCLAICQSAHTPDTDEDWASLGYDKLSRYVTEYLSLHHDEFYLYGEHPFLQFPALQQKAQELNKKTQDHCPNAALFPEVAQNNNVVLFDTQKAFSLNDAQKALTLIRMQGFALGTKRTANVIVLTEGYRGKSKTSSPGVSLGKSGYLHTFFEGETLQETFWLNLLTMKDISSFKPFTKGLGIAPWERMPEGEDDQIAKDLKTSYMGILMPMDRFLYFYPDSDICEYTEGIGYQELERHIDFSCGFEASNLQHILIAEPSMRPWRQLSSLLSFLDSTNSGGGQFVIRQISLPFTRVKNTIKVREIGFFCGGLAVSSTAGEQFVQKNNDYVESHFKLDLQVLNESFFVRFTQKMQNLEKVAQILNRSVKNYFEKGLKFESEQAKLFADQATARYWERAEDLFSLILDSCNPNEKELSNKLKSRIFDLTEKVYATCCSYATARQLVAFIQYDPRENKKMKSYFIKEV